MCAVVVSYTNRLIDPKVLALPLPTLAAQQPGEGGGGRGWQRVVQGVVGILLLIKQTVSDEARCIR
jgi:hypothetical protein